MNVVLMLDKYYPAPQANGNCARAILNAMDDCHVDVICKVYSEKDYHLLKQQGGNIHPVLSKTKSSGENAGAVSRVLQILRKTYQVLLGARYSRQESNAYISTFEQIRAGKKIDAIIAVQDPRESVEAACKLKKKYPDTTMIIYDLDTASNCSMGIIERCFQKWYLHRVYLWEKKVFQQADLIVHLAQHKRHFSEGKYVPFLEKTLFQEVPLLNCAAIQNEPQEKQKKTFLYSGSFYKKLRAPALVTNFMDEICNRTESEVLYYVNNEYYPILSEQYKGRKNVSVSPFVPEAELIKIIEKTDFLLSLGNKDTEMFPSKVVQYVSARKPIIHIHQTETDPVIPFLQDYPDKLLISSNDGFGENCDRIMEFLNQRREAIPSQYIEKTYEIYSGKYNAEQIRAFFAKKCEK